MLIAHLPAGYVLGKTARLNRPVFGAVLLASVLPDFDMLWFHFVDQGAVHHHYYWTHAPAFWLMLAAALAIVFKFTKPQWLLPLLWAFVAVELHLIMDTLVGSIMWLWPYSRAFYQMAVVPSTQSNWVLSFIFHWSFLVELVIVVFAGFLFLKDTRQCPPQNR